MTHEPESVRRDPWDEAAVLRHLGGVIKARREALGWTLDDLARRTGFTSSPLSALERGEAWMRMPSVLKIAYVLEIPPEQLVPAPRASPLHEVMTLLLTAPPRILEGIHLLLRHAPPEDPRSPPGNVQQYSSQALFRRPTEVLGT